MTQLMRNALRDITKKLDSAHAGLLIQRGLSEWEEGEKSTKAALIETISNISASPIYQLALNRWIGITHSHERFSHLVLTTENRLFTGLATGGTLETGIYTHHSYAMPMLAGSSIKGAARSYAQSINLPKDYQAILFGSGGEDSGEENSEDISGALIWHDAWWIPHKQDKPFKPEIITVHHQDYYNGSAETADGTESPIPNQQLATSGGFYFVIEGDNTWAQYACQLLSAMLKQQGMGAKTASGYGYFRPSESHEKEINKCYQEWQKHTLAAQQASGAISPDELLSHHIQNTALSEWAERIDKNAKMKEWLVKIGYEPEDNAVRKRIAELMQQYHPQAIAAWQQSNKKTEKEAYKKLEKWLKP